jgi:hypothetical protein
MEEEIKLNGFNRELVEKARKAGFTDAQINFLTETFEFAEKDY